MNKDRAYIMGIIAMSLVLVVNTYITYHHETMHEQIALNYGCEVNKKATGILLGYTVWTCEDYDMNYNDQQMALDSFESYTITNLLRFILSIIVITIFMYWL